MIAAVREDDSNKETAAPAHLDNQHDQLPIAYIPACGTLCDAFWWMRRTAPKKPPE